MPHIIKRQPEPIFGLIVPNIVYELYIMTVDRKKSELKIKKEYGIDSSRFINIVGVNQGFTSKTLIIIYDKRVSENERLKYSHLGDNMESFDFPIVEHSKFPFSTIEEYIELMEEQ